MPAEADLVAYLDPLVAETGGTDLFEGPMPESPDNCIAVAHYDSPALNDRVMGGSLANNIGVSIVMVQVMARNTSKTTAQSKAQGYFNLLDNLGPVTLTGRLYHSVEGEGEPFNLGQDQNGRWRYAFNVRVEKARG